MTRDLNGRNLTIWCNNGFSGNQQTELDLLTKEVGEHSLTILPADQDGTQGPAREILQTADIAFGFPNAQAVSELPNIRWVQLNAAGYTSYDEPKIRSALTARGTIVTNSSAVYDEPCAEHLLAMITSLARGLPTAMDAQRGDREWRMFIRPTLPLLQGQTALILGFGAIAKRLVELLQPLAMNLVAVRRYVSGDETIRVVPVSRLDEWLPWADHVISTLPANDESTAFLSAERLAKLKPGAIVYNIGRGTTLDQDALIKALRSGHLAAAYLDVTNPEPLPPDHPLWCTPNCFITPHLGGGHTS